MPRTLCSLVLNLAALSGAAVAGDGAVDPLRPADTSSPRDTLVSFLDNCQAAYDVSMVVGRASATNRKYRPIIERIADCFDLSEEAGYQRVYSGREAAVCLKETLDRIEIKWDEIPDLEGIAAIEEETGEPYTRCVLPGTEITIAQIAEGPRLGQWAFDPVTVRNAKRFYDAVSYLPYREDRVVSPYRPEGDPDERYPFTHTASKGLFNYLLSEPAWRSVAYVVHRLPEWCRHRVGGQSLWQWASLVLTVLLALGFMVALYRLGRRQARQSRRRANWIRYVLTLSFPIAAMLVPLWVRGFIDRGLAISGPLLIGLQFAMNLSFLVALVVVVLSLGNRLAELIIASPKIHSRGIDAQFIRLVSRVLGLAAATVVFVEGGQYLGIPITTLLAGAGVSGLAVALAAQDTLKNLFGSLMILLDKPFRAGERVVVGSFDGVVEEIGLRSTKLRLLTGHQVAVPNEEMARAHIENIGRRPHIRRVQDLALALDTPPAKAEEAVAIVRRLLENHDGMAPDLPPRVYLNEFNRDSINLRFMYWRHPPEYWEFMEMSQRLNLAILEAFEAAGIRLAPPASTIAVHPATEPSLDSDAER